MYPELGGAFYTALIRAEARICVARLVVLSRFIDVVLPYFLAETRLRVISGPPWVLIAQFLGTCDSERVGMVNLTYYWYYTNGYKQEG